MIRFTIALCAAVLFGTLAFAPEDAEAFGRRRHAGCSGAHAQASCSEAYAGCAGDDGWYWGKRRAERHARKAAKHAALAAAYGCGGATAASCAAPATDCAGGYSVAPPAPVHELAPEPTTAGCPCGCPDCTCNRAGAVTTPACPIDPATGLPVCPNPTVQ
jgi:hypothetical protein